MTMMRGRAHRLRKETPVGCRGRRDKLLATHTLASLLAFLLIGVAVAPLLLLGLYAVASYFELKVADRILDATLRFLKLQWFSGGLPNLAGGLVIAALGIWMAMQAGPHLESQ